MATRFRDDLRQTSANDFIVRKHVPFSLQILLAFGIAFVAIFLTAIIMRDTGSNTLFAFTLTLTIGSLSWVSVCFSARQRDLVLTTEFQNAMLASAARLSTRFCLITKADGSIVYIDPGFQRMFPDFLQGTDRNVEGLMRSVGIGQDVTQSIFVILEKEANDRVLLPLKDASGDAMPIMLSIDVLPRPAGYFLMRGRDYVEKRRAESAATSTATPLASALQTLPEGIIVADANGAITYANHTLEAWLGYDGGELSRASKLGNIFYQYDGSEAGRMIAEDFTGTITMQRKDRGLIKLFIRQLSLGRAAGLSALISLPSADKR